MQKLAASPYMVGFCCFPSHAVSLPFPYHSFVHPRVPLPPGWVSTTNMFENIFIVDLLKCFL